MASTEVTLPEIGEGVTEGELVQWLVKAGDSIEEEQAIAEIMTDKATVEVPSPISGTVGETRFSEGDIIKVGDVMMTVDGASGSPAKTAEAPAKEPAPAAATAPTSTPAPASAPMVASNAAPAAPQPPVAEVNVLATPSTRRLAREMNVDINGITGTGLSGRVTREDVLGSVNGTGAVAAGPATYQPPKVAYSAPTGGAEERVPLRGIRRKIAQNMQMAKHIIPHFTIMDDADVTELVELRTSLKEGYAKQGVKITYLPFVIKALISTCREFPAFNASIDDEAQEIVYKHHFNIGFAADTPNGLMVPVIKNAETKSLLHIAQEILELATKAREGKLALDEMTGATITITNIGAVGGTYATPIINHPEVAIIGMYKIEDKPIVENGELSVIKSMNFTATADHRLIDGAVAANFLKAFIQRIQSPGRLMMDMI